MPKKFRVKSTRHLKSAFTYAGYTPYFISKTAKKEIEETVTEGVSKIKKRFGEKKEKPKPITAYQIHAGPIKGQTKRSAYEMLPNIHPSELPPDIKTHIEQEWKPHSQLTVYDDVAHKALTAAEANRKHIADKKWLPMYFQNPMQSYDYLVYESLLKNTILGPLSLSLIRFLMGTGFKPKLILNRPSGDKKKDADLIKQYEFVTNNLSYVDRAISKSKAGDGIDISFIQKITNLFLNTLSYNRSALVKKYDDTTPYMLDLMGDGKMVAVKGLPRGLVDIHPRDIGIVKISPKTNKMTAVQISQIQDFVPVDEMIYMWNSQHGASIYNAKYYGGSMLMPTIEPGRIIQSQVSSIFPAISENMSGGLYHIFIRPEGGTEAARAAEYGSLVEAVNYGEASIAMIDPERVKYENVNFDPKINDLIQMFETQIKYCVACFNLPQFGFYDEAASNFATAVERIQLAISTSINPMREWLGEDFSRQWYDANFRIMYADQPDILDLFTIGVEFEDLQIETLQQRAETLDTLANVGIQLDDEKMEEVIQIEGLADHMVDVPMDPMNMGAPQQNKNFTVKAPVGSGGGGKSGTGKFKVKQG